MQHLIQYLMGGVSSKAASFVVVSVQESPQPWVWGNEHCRAAPAEFDPNQSVAHATMTEESGLCLVEVFKTLLKHTHLKMSGTSDQTFSAKGILRVFSLHSCRMFPDRKRCPRWGLCWGYGANSPVGLWSVNKLRKMTENWKFWQNSGSYPLKTGTSFLSTVTFRFRRSSSPARWSAWVCNLHDLLILQAEQCH